MISQSHWRDRRVFFKTIEENWGFSDVVTAKVNMDHRVIFLQVGAKNL